MEQILFVFGAARGGTTFFADVLGDFLDCGNGPEGTFVPAMVAKAEALGDLEDSENTKRYAEALARVEMLEIIRKRWPEDVGFDVRPEEILARMPERTVAGGIFAVFKTLADKQGRKRISSKNPEFVYQLPLLDRLFGEHAKYLFIVRDGRDVALSLARVPWGGQTVYESARIWRDVIGRATAFQQVVGAERFFTIRYEDLLQQPGEAIEAVATFIGEDESSIRNIRRAFVEYSSENAKSANFGKWKERMPVGDQRVFEAVAGEELSRYAYDREWPLARLSWARRGWYEVLRIVRLVRLNIYHAGRSLPRDKKSWRYSQLLEWIKPGGN